MLAMLFSPLLPPRRHPYFLGDRPARSANRGGSMILTSLGSRISHAMLMNTKAPINNAVHGWLVASFQIPIVRSRSVSL